MIRHSQASTLSPSRLGTVRRALMPNSSQTWLRMGPRANRVAQSRPPPRHRLRRKRMTVPQRKRKRKEERNFSTRVQHSLMRHPKNLSKIHEQISGGQLWHSSQHSDVTVTREIFIETLQMWFLNCFCIKLPFSFAHMKAETKPNTKSNVISGSFTIWVTVKFPCISRTISVQISSSGTSSKSREHLTPILMRFQASMFKIFAF